MSKPDDGKAGEADEKPKKTEPVLSATEKMMVEMQKRKIQAMRMKKEQLELFRDTFVIFDKDGDGTIDSKELSTVLKSMGYNPTIEEIKEMVEDVDSDGSGSIEFLEFLLLMGKILKVKLQTHLKSSQNHGKNIYLGCSNRCGSKGCVYSF